MLNYKYTLQLYYKLSIQQTYITTAKLINTHNYYLLLLLFLLLFITCFRTIGIK
jgi:hypothetical protein